jgi:SAM-dependent methyltransferase
VLLTPSDFEDAYLVGCDAPKASGCNSGAEGWEIGRRSIADAVHRGGSFLDIGCANGLLMESIVGWSRHPLEPYGLDFAPKLVELGRSRLPQWADRIFLGDILEWEPARRFDFVRTELVYASQERERELVERLLGWLEPDGRLIVCGYGDKVRARVRAWSFEPELELEWRSATGRFNELAAIGLQRVDGVPRKSPESP